MEEFVKKLALRLQTREKQQLLRKLPHPLELSKSSSGEIKSSDFSSNDYLGLARSEVLAQRWQAAMNMVENNNFSTRLGSTGSRLLSGNTTQAMSLESELALLHQTQAALLFNSGYDANIGLISSLAGREDVILLDQAAHASLWDGARLSLAKHYHFRHNDLSHCEEKLQWLGRPCIIVVESVYSMDGDLAPLTELTQLAARYQSVLIVDEAHATGVFGERGLGLVQQLGLDRHVLARVHTFGKALGGHGAVVVGTQLLIDTLVNFARSFIYTTTLPVHSLIAIQEAYKLMMESEAQRQQLWSLINQFKDFGQNQPFLSALTPNPSPIQGLIIPGNTQVKNFANHLQKQGFDIRAVLSPTVRAGQERLRINLHAFNTAEELARLQIAIAENWGSKH